MFEKGDETLVRQALKGNKKAWYTLLTRYEQPVFHYGIRMTGNRDDAADLMQEIFISVFKSLANFRGDGSFKCWLFKIAHYRCMEFYRRKRSDLGLEDAPEQEVENGNPELTWFHEHSNKAVTVAMLQLPVNQRAVVELKFFGQFTFDEIGIQLGISSNTVKSRLYSALSKLKLELEVAI